MVMITCLIHPDTRSEDLAVVVTIDVDVDFVSSAVC